MGALRTFGEEYEYYASGGIIDYSYIEKESGVRAYLSSVIGNNYIDDIFITEIEILEEVEDKEYEDMEELDILPDCESYSNKILYGKINALIRNQKKILERLDK